MKAFKFLLPVVAMLLIGTSCNKYDGYEPTVDPSIYGTLVTFIVELEETPEMSQIGIDYTEQFKSIFKGGEFSFYGNIITAMVTGNDVCRFLWIINNFKYVISVTEPKVDPPTEVTLRTFMVELEEIPKIYQIVIECAYQFSQKFHDSKFSFYRNMIAARVPEKDVDKFLKVMNDANYVISVKEI